MNANQQDKSVQNTINKLAMDRANENGLAVEILYQQGALFDAIAGLADENSTTATLAQIGGMLTDLNVSAFEDGLAESEATLKAVSL